MRLMKHSLQGVRGLNIYQIIEMEITAVYGFRNRDCGVSRFK